MSSIKYDRLYSGSDGRSRVQKNLEIELTARDFVPPAPPIGVSEFKPASTYAFLVVPAGFIGDWHPSPKRQWVFYLQGEMEYEAGGRYEMVRRSRKLHAYRGHDGARASKSRRQRDPRITGGRTA